MSAFLLAILNLFKIKVSRLRGVEILKPVKPPIMVYLPLNKDLITAFRTLIFSLLKG